MYSSIHDSFTGGESYFLTFKSDKKPSHQSIDFVRKLVSKHSKTYLIVREKNKKTEGYHFHALFKCNKAPPKTWYIKGAHMNLLRVGRYVPVDFKITEHQIPVTLEEDNALLEGLIDQKEYERVKEDKLYKNQIKIVKRCSHITRLLTYMSKEAELPAQYSDYLYCFHGKQVKLY